MMAKAPEDRPTPTEVANTLRGLRSKVKILEEQMEAFRQELLKNPSISHVSVTNAVPGGLIGNNVYLPEGESNDDTHALNFLFTDSHFQETYRLEMIEGRWFREDMPSDSSALVLNEAAVQALGFDDPLNKRLITQFGDEAVDPLPVIGVVKDFNYQSLHQEIMPLAIHFSSGNRYQMTVRISGNQTSKSLTYIEETWNSFQEQQPVHMTFLGEDLAELYDNEQKTATVFNIFSVLALFIAALGLLGLASFSHCS